MSESTPSAATATTAPAEPAAPDVPGGLPSYARGLLRIQIPVRVNLASQRTSIREIIELGPGSIVKFNRTCDEPLSLFAGEREIALGEVVKVGDKFGFRINSLLGI